MNWISVKDRLPEPYVEVLIRSKIGNKHIGYYYNGDFYVYTDSVNKKINPTHWMNIPEPFKREYVPNNT